MIFSFFRKKPPRHTGLPAFLIIGAQKSGTSWLHACLRQHPAAFLPEDKDSEADFQKPDQLATYLKRFATAEPGQLIGDACAAWFWTRRGNDPQTGQPRNIVDDIRHLFGHRTKIIILARNPVQRAVSGYLHHIRFRSASANTPILETSPDLGILALSQYGFHLRNWLRHYPARQIQVLPAPGEGAPEEILTRVIDFLQLPGSQPPPASRQVVMPGIRKIIDENGVWVDADSPEIRETAFTRPVACRTIDNRKYLRLIEPQELATIARQLKPDTTAFLRLAEKHGWHHPAFEKW